MRGPSQLFSRLGSRLYDRAKVFSPAGDIAIGRLERPELLRTSLTGAEPYARSVSLDGNVAAGSRSDLQADLGVLVD
jgi:hypothetical protein